MELMAAILGVLVSIGLHLVVTHEPYTSYLEFTNLVVMGAGFFVSMVLDSGFKRSPLTSNGAYYRAKLLQIVLAFCAAYVMSYLAFMCVQEVLQSPITYKIFFRCLMFLLGIWLLSAYLFFALTQRYTTPPQ